MTNTLEEDLKRIRSKRTARKRKSFSRLNRHRKQIEELDELGASREEIRIWLRQKGGINVVGSTISRALKRWKAAKQQ